MIFSANPIAVGDFASKQTPDLDNIWAPKSIPVCGFFYFHKNFKLYAHKNSSCDLNIDNPQYFFMLNTQLS